MPDRFGVFDLPDDPRAFGELDTLGVGWVRLQFRLGEVPIERLIEPAALLFANGQGLWLTLHHRDRSNIADTAGFDAAERGSYPPADTLRYHTAIQALVVPLADSLRAQGKVPAQWLLLQLSNEVTPSDIAPPSPTRYWHGTSDEYLETLALTYHAVKAADASAIPVAHSGIASTALEAILAGTQEIIDWNNRLLTEGRFDWADVHLRHDPATLGDKIAWVRARWGGPVAASEFAGPDERTGVTYSESLQAQELVTRMNHAFAANLDRVFWSHLVENPAVEPTFFREGLIEHETWRRKPVFFAYRDYIAQATARVPSEPLPPSWLGQNYPNPFSGRTTIPFTVQQPGTAQIAIFDLLGRTVATLETGPLAPGPQAVTWEATSLPSGLYLYQLRLGSVRHSRLMTLVR